MEAESFAQSSFNAVAKHGLANRSGNGETQAWTIPRSFLSSSRQTKRGEQRAGKADTLVINFAEVGRAQNPGLPGEP